MCVISKIFVVILGLFCVPIFAEHFAATSSYQVCFTPGGKCTAQIVSAINGAQQQILVQAYAFTSRAIARALVNAQQRGVQVVLLLDKSIVDNQPMLAYFKRENVPYKIDTMLAVAHNKVMIIDCHLVITGSFNFTIAAEKDNAENVLIIDDQLLAQKYLDNWHRRERAANKFNFS